MRLFLRCVLISVGCCLVTGVLVIGRTQIRPAYNLGIAGLVQKLGRLQTTASAMHIGAHPDDEDTSLIAKLALGSHARTSYLSLTRGGGGQNVIGPELFEALGVIRTEELLQARKLDGGEQLFTRAVDFGYSKTRVEASEKWGEKTILKDMVRAIRLFRPLVIVSRFSGTEADGHGQHQMAGYLASLAFRAAADSGQFPEQLTEGMKIWQAKKFYVGEGFRHDPLNLPTLQIQTGEYDPLIGRSYAEVAMEGRSQHKSQKMGVLEFRGARTSGLRLVSSSFEVAENELDIFDGLDVSIQGLARLADLSDETLETELRTIDRAAKRALLDLDVEAPWKVVPILAKGLRSVRRALEMITDDSPMAAEAIFLLQHKEKEFEASLVHAAGLVVDVLSDTETVTSDDSVLVTLRAYLAAPMITTINEMILEAPTGWSVETYGETKSTEGGTSARFFREKPDRQESFRVVASSDAQVVQPYWLTESHNGEVFPWPEGDLQNRPFAPPLVHGRVSVEIGGVAVEVVKPLEFRFADPVRGELRRNVDVVPAITVALDSDLEIIPVSESYKACCLEVRVESHVARPLTGWVQLNLPDGWMATPAKVPFTLDTKGDMATAEFSVSSSQPLVEGSHRIRALAVVEDKSFDTEMQTITYPHIQTHRIYRPAEILLQVVDFHVAPVTVGYIMGSGDRVPEALVRMGLTVTMLGPDELRSGDLSRFDTIVVGIRASEARPDFVNHHDRLLDYVRQGGTLIVQYQQTNYVRDNLTPFPAEMRSRVSDERAPVRILEINHPVFLFPNQIVDEDWEGWVQERNLYAFTSFDNRFTPLLESFDPGEAPQRGGQVYAKLGRGHYIYTSYSWFRQLPAGVPGAYRMFANFVSLPNAR